MSPERRTGTRARRCPPLALRARACDESFTVLLSATTLLLPTGERIVLRSPLGPDAATLLAFVRALTTESWRNLNHPASFFDSMDDDKERAFIESAASHPTSFLLTAFHDGVAIGNVGTIPS